MRRLLTAALVAFGLGFSGCGGWGDRSPMTQGGLSSAPAGAIAIDVVGENGTRSFSPNPATVPVGTMVTWHNVDGTAHHVVLDDGQMDAGNLPPGRFSPAMPLVRPGPYHCTIHPSMVGAIVSGQ